MKNYDERIESIFRKYDRRLSEKQRKTAIIRRTLLSTGIGAAAVTGVILTSGELLKNAPDFPQPDTLITETPTAPSTVPVSDTATTSPATRTHPTPTTAAPPATAAPRPETAPPPPVTAAVPTQTSPPQTTPAPVTTMPTTTEPQVQEEPPLHEDPPSPIGPPPLEPAGEADPIVGQKYYLMRFNGEMYIYFCWDDDCPTQPIGTGTAFGSDPSDTLECTVHATNPDGYCPVKFPELDGCYLYIRSPQKEDSP